MTAFEFLSEYCSKHPEQEFSFLSHNPYIVIKFRDYKTCTKNQYIIPLTDLQAMYSSPDDIAVSAMKKIVRESEDYTENLTNISKFLSLILRHKPEAIGINLDKHGWANVDELIAGIQKTRKFDMAMLEHIVESDEKGRYSFNDDKTKIRANQGHSIQEIDLELEELEPPPVLYHGTAVKNLSSIIKKGLLPMSRQYVHLTKDYNTAVDAGKRHGEPVVLMVEAIRMCSCGHKFYRSENGVWLTDHVPRLYISAIAGPLKDGALRCNPWTGENWILYKGEWEKA